MQINIHNHTYTTIHINSNRTFGRGGARRGGARRGGLADFRPHELCDHLLW